MKRDAISEALQRRKAAERYRMLPAENNLIDFCSNDYLGFARSEALKKMVLDEYVSFDGRQVNGSTGSRLISGNSKYVQDIEDFIAQYHRAEAALIFNSGYDANTGLLSSIPQQDDIILYDELVHTSLRDGIRLSRAKSISFSHNDLNQLTSLIQDLSSQYSVLTTHYYIIVESVYSMDGDFAPLAELCSMCETHGYHLIIDEAHATGIYGRKGEGRVGELGLEKFVFARIHTFGKALGTFGAAIIGSKTLIDFLINYARPFIYTTALPPILLAGIKCAYSLLPGVSEDVNKIKRLISLFREKLSDLPAGRAGDALILITGSLSPVQAVLIEGNRAAKSLAASVQRNGYDVRPILYPSVPEGKERLRICIHSFNTEEEVNGLVNTMKKGIEEIR